MKFGNEQCKGCNGFNGWMLRKEVLGSRFERIKFDSLSGSKVGIAHPTTGENINPYCLTYSVLLLPIGGSGIRKTNRRNVNLCLTD
jgi:hypothetical protein